jgi:hypothetical protein
METIALFAVKLQGAAPEIDTPGLTKHWSVMRSFPKDAAQRDCHEYLFKIMRTKPDLRGKKGDIKNYCRKKFGVTAESFECAWREANEATGAGWNGPGRRPR